MTVFPDLYYARKTDPETRLSGGPVVRARQAHADVDGSYRPRMGYDVRVIRSAKWSDASEISLSEWLDVVEARQELRLVGFVEATSPSGEVVRYNNPALAEWLSHPSGQPVFADLRAYADDARFKPDV